VIGMALTVVVFWYLCGFQIYTILTQVDGLE
jgi:hypothetical protein